MEKQMITKVNFGKRISDLRIGGDCPKTRMSFHQN